MDAFPVVLLALLTTLILGGIVAVYALRQHRSMPSRPTDYRAFFVMGVIMLFGCAVFFVIGAALDVSWAIGVPILILGVVYTALGWSHRGRWSHR